MLKQIVIDSHLSMTRIGIIQENKLTHIYIEDHEDLTLQNTVLQGQVQQVVKNLKGAFVDFGIDKKGLLHFKNVPECYSKNLQQGMRIPVQIQKENTGEKGNRLTAMVSIPGYYLVALPYEPGIQISKKIKSTEVRNHLKQLLSPFTSDQMGLIVRTNAKEAQEEDIIGEATYLMEKTLAFHQMKGNVQKGTVLIEAEPLFWEVIKEHVKATDEVVFLCNNERVKEALQEKLSIFLPKLQYQLKSYPYYENLFRLMSIEKDFVEILKRKIWLKNGGNIVIDYTEAMTVIDVNSAKAIMGKEEAKAITKLNKLAMEESIYQIIRRNLSGIILVDLVDFKSHEDRMHLYEWVRQRLAVLDGSRSKVYPPTELDLLQITRTKKYLPLYQKLLTKKDEHLGLYNQPQLSFINFKLEVELKHIVTTTQMKEIYLYCKEWLYKSWKHSDFMTNVQTFYGLKINLFIEENEKELDFNIRFHKQ